MVNFGGTMFFEMDDFQSRISGAPVKTLILTATSTSNGTSFKSATNLINVHKTWEEYNSAVKKLNNVPVNTLDDFIKVIPQLVAKKYFTMDYVNYSPEYKWDEVGWESKFSSYRADVHYDQFDPLPKVFTFDNKAMEWKVTKILP